MRKIAVLFFIFALCLPALAETKIANDPSRIGVGARILGMGKSYVGMADELSSIFINPAGLSSVSNFQATSMSGKFINEYNYLNFGAATPTPLGTIGIGYVGSDIGFTAPAATFEVIDGIRIIPSSTEGVNFGYNNRVFLFGLSRPVFDVPVGLTLKYFQADMSGPGITDGTARGMDLDLGFNYRFSSFFKTGLVLQNILPANMGGKIVWGTKSEESLPSVVKLGAQVRLLGEEGWNQLGRHELSLNMDGDFTPLRQNLPALYHLGLEWSPSELMDLRAGVDQETVGRSETGSALSVSNNLTLGVGLYVRDYRFDLAYHQYNQVSENDTYYFSISYGVGKKKIPEQKGPLFSLKPRDKSVRYTPEVKVEGKILRADVSHAALDGVEFRAQKSSFEVTVPLKLGKNEFSFQAYNPQWKMLGSTPLRILRLSTFWDISSDYWAKTPIEGLATLGVISGFPDGTFRPQANITRADLRALLAKAFAATREAISRPRDEVTRAEGVALFARFAKLPRPALAEVPFKDLPGRYWAVKDIAAAKEAGLLKYLEGKPFEPKKKLTRAEAAEILSRTKIFADRLRGLRFNDAKI